MLVRTLFVIFLIAVLSEAVVFGAASLARAELQHRSIEAARVALTTGAQTAQALVAADVASGGTGAGWTSTQPHTSCAATRADGTCTLHASISVAPATPPPSVGAGCAQSTNCTVYAQGNDAILERRAYALVVATITDASGTTLATRSSTIAYRIFDQAPYATLAGALDSSLSSGNGVVSDDGGNAATGTLVHVQYRNTQTGTISSGDVWAPSSQNYGAQAAPWQP